MDLDVLSSTIKPLDPARQPAISEAERDFFRHYRINFEETIDDVDHHFGYFPCGRFDIVAHYYDLKGARETCFIVHGYYDHAGLFGHLIEYCLKRGVSVVIFDLPGHGLSTGEQASIQSFTEYQQVLRDVIAFFADVAPVPWIAMGQSTGGAILMDYLLTSNDARGDGQSAPIFEKAVLLAPLVRVNHWPLSSITHTIARLLVKKVPRDFAPSSHDQEFLRFVKQRDPLQSRVLPVQWVTALKQWMKTFLRLQPSSFRPLVIQGKEDSTVDWQYNLGIVKQKFPNATLYYIQNGRHHLANESEAIRHKMTSAMDIYFDLHS